MNKLSCNIVRDLLPLYCDMVLEEESVKEVENHLKGCHTCQEMYEKMNGELWGDCPQKKKKEVPNIQTLFRKIKIRNTIIFCIFAIIVMFLSGSFWKVPANAVDFKKIYIDTAEYKYTDSNKESEFVKYFNIDYEANGIPELNIKFRQKDVNIYMTGKRSLFSIMKSDGGTVQLSGRTGFPIENAETIKQVYFNGSLIWDVNIDGEITEK